VVLAILAAVARPGQTVQELMATATPVAVALAITGSVVQAVVQPLTVVLVRNSMLRTALVVVVAAPVRG
jgi:hypothetical protein